MFVIDGSGVMDAKVSEFMTPYKKDISARLRRHGGLDYVNVNGFLVLIEIWLRGLVSQLRHRGESIKRFSGESGNVRREEEIISGRFLVRRFSEKPHLGRYWWDDIATSIIETVLNFNIGDFGWKRMSGLLGYSRSWALKVRSQMISSFL